MDPPPPTHWLARPAATVLACYWLALAIATHWPHPPQVLSIGGTDKFIHVTVFTGLAVLACLNWSLRRPFGWRAAATVAGVLMLYGALDEVTQTPVGRHANLQDWFADAGGTALGIALFALVAALVRRARSNAAQRLESAAETAGDAAPQ